MQKVKDNLLIKAVFKGNLLGLAVFTVLALSFSFAFLKLGTSQSSYFSCLILATLLSGFSAGFAGARKVKKNGIVIGFLCAILPCISLVIAMSAANKGVSVYESVPLVSCLVGSAGGGITAVNIKHKNKPKRRK